jgi:hypothetical protein
MSTSTRKAEMRAIPDIPSLRFRNDTHFDALHFDTLDQHDAGFHVIVAKTGYTFGKCDSNGFATLVPLDPPAALHHEDRYYDDSVDRSVRVESDLAPYKPRCDVVVIGDAHAPAALAAPAAASFTVALRVQYPDQPEPVPEPPHPLNPFQPVSSAAQQRWRAEVEQAAGRVIPGRRVIDKVLHVTGPRELRRRTKALGLLRPAAAMLSLGAIEQSPWALTQSAPAVRVPIRYEYAQGGQVIVDGDSPVAGRVPQRWRLDAGQMTQYSHLAIAPAAHDACQLNPVGKGFAPAWYLDAADPARLPAPQIEYPGAPFSAGLFWAGSRGKTDLAPAGFGVVGRAWLPRRELIGTLDSQASWADEDVPRLPQDFDFGYWNGAPADQQCEHLNGEERFTLVNISAAESESARLDRDGNSVLRFSLPAQSLFVLAADNDDAVAALPLAVDTVVIDTLSGTVELTWRSCLIADGQFAEVRLMHASTPEQLHRLALWNQPAATVENTAPSASA